MKVLVISAEYPPIPGGVGDYSCQLVQGLADLGEELCVLTTTERRAGDLSRGSAETSWRFPKGQKISYAVPAWNWRAWPTIKRRVQAERPDVVHLQYQAAAYGMRAGIHAVPALIHSWAIRPLVVVTFHDLREPYLFPKAGPLRAGALRLLAHGADATIVTNGEDLADLRRWHHGASTMIPIGSNVPDQPPAGFDREAWRRQCQLAPDEIVIVFFGFLNRSKGVAELLQAIAVLREEEFPLRLVIVGGGTGTSDPTNREYERIVRRRVRELDLESALVWTGYQAPDAVSAYLRSADLCALPYTDGLSTRRGTLMAALEHGVPVLSTMPRTPVPELRDEQEVLLAASAAPADLIGPLRRLSTDAALRERLRNGAREASRHFTWRRIAVRHAVLYRRLARGACIADA